MSDRLKPCPFCGGEGKFSLPPFPWFVPVVFR